MVSLDQFNNFGAIDVNIERPVLEEKSSFKMLGLNFFSKLDWGFYIVSIAKTASKKNGFLICFMNFLPPEVALYLYNLSYDHAWKTAVMSKLVLIVATWDC